MLSGSAILRISLLLVVAGCLAALIQYLLPHAAPTAGVPSATPSPVAPAPRTIVTSPPYAAPPRDVVASPKPSPAAVPPPAPVPVPVPMPQPTEQAAAAPPPLLGAPPAPSEPAPPQPTGQAEVDEADSTAGPRALALVDLNTASVAELNGLRGGGSIGRAIVQRRPYTAIDQLLSKRVLSRATYDKIKDQVTVR